MGRFTAERRERLLTLLETGRNLEEAAADVGVNPSTVARWAAQGRAGVDDAHVVFSERYDAIRQGDGEPLSEEDVVRLLEQAARKGSVTAMRTLLDRFKGHQPPARVGDEFDELKERRRARAG